MSSSEVVQKGLEAGSRSSTEVIVQADHEMVSRSKSGIVWQVTYV